MDRSERKALEEQVDRLVLEFLTRSRGGGVYKRDHVARLAELATSEDQDAARTATAGIFSSLIEPLADSFRSEAISLYNRLFAQLIQFCRGTAHGRDLHQELVGFGLTSEDDLIARAEGLRHVGQVEDFRLRTIRRVIVLSRVTLGADAAITSVILGRMKHLFPDADVTLVGPRKMMELFTGDLRLGLHETNYRRAGTLNERLLSWMDVLTSVRVLTQGLRQGDFLVVDPDSRLTQLGLLPIGGNERPTTKGTGELRASELTTRDPLSTGYLFFPSREYGNDSSHSLARLASMWITEVFGQGEPCLPKLALSKTHVESAEALVQALKRSKARPLISINLGVGENQSKRVGQDFEEALICSLVRQGCAVILDKGSGPDEATRADALVGSAIRSLPGVKIVEAVETTLKRLAGSQEVDADIVVWQGRIGILAALIGASDLYIGYDSAGQHLAAALGVPCIDIFADPRSPRFVDRWRPTGPAPSWVITAKSPNTEATLEDVMRAKKQLLAE